MEKQQDEQATGIVFNSPEEFNAFNTGRGVRTLSKHKQSSDDFAEQVKKAQDERNKRKKKLGEVTEQKLHMIKEKLTEWGYSSVLHLPTAQVDKVLELARIVQPKADFTYLKKSTLGRDRFLRSIFKGKPFVIQDKSGKQYEADLAMEHELSKVQYDTDINFSRLQVAIQNLTKWKNTGFYNYLRLMYANNESYYQSSRETITTASFAYLDTKLANTSQIGLFNDKGLTGYIGSSEYDKKAPQNMAYILGLEWKSFNKFLKKMADSVMNLVSESEQSRRKVYSFLTDFYQSGVILKEHLKAPMSSESLSEKLGYGMSPYAIKQNITTVQKEGRMSDQTVALASEVGVPYSDSHIELILYNYKGILFTTSRYIKMSCIDVLQSNNLMRLPCIGLIKDILFNLLLSCDGGSYMKGGHIVPYTTIFTNIYNKADDSPVLLHVEDNVPYFHIKANLYPFYAAQKGSSQSSHVEVSLYDIDMLDICNKDEWVHKVHENPNSLPLGKMTPLAVFHRTEDNAIKAKILSLEEPESYEISEELYVLNFIKNFINTDELVDLPDSDLSISHIYSEVTTVLQECLREMLIRNAEINPSVTPTVGSSILTAKENTTHIRNKNTQRIVYRCPITIEFDGDFIL